MSEKNFRTPLALHFVWHCNDEEKVNLILDEIIVNFARDVEKPFSRGLNIPLFFYSSFHSKNPPNNFPDSDAIKNLIFIFTSKNTMGYKDWLEYINKIEINKNSFIVPIALEREGMNHSRKGVLKNFNFLRFFDFEKEYYEKKALLAIAHEIYRYGLVTIKSEDVGKCSSIKIFLSHTKVDEHGFKVVKEVLKYINNTNMNKFFDATEISPGFKFNEEITKHIESSSLLAFSSDRYSSRYWCQKEMLCAKQNRIPIVIVDCLREYEDRVFPFGANVPCVHISHEDIIKEKDILRILNSILLETIRNFYELEKLKNFKEIKWIPEDSLIISRPPEIFDVLNAKEENLKNICYPDPQVYFDESEWVEKLDIKPLTPLCNEQNFKLLEELKIGISISKLVIEDFQKHHLHSNHLKRLAQDLARNLLIRGSIIIYGGDLRKDGFTEFILDEGMYLQNRLKTDEIYIKNNLAWPIYISESEIVAWRAKYDTVMMTEQHEIPNDIKDCVDEKNFLKPIGEANKYIWSRSLTNMREISIEDSDVRICAGGKLIRYLGKMPGVLEEVLISLDRDKPIFLLGAFGGVIGEVCKTISTGKITEPLTEKWQINNNERYNYLLEYARKKGFGCDYSEIREILEGIKIKKLAKNAGLEEADYQRLMTTPFIDECIHLIIKGLNEIKNRNSI